MFVCRATSKQRRETRKHTRNGKSPRRLQKLQRESENRIDQLLQSVHKYDIGKISEACNPDQLPSTPLDRPRYSFLARITRNIQTELLIRLRSALKKNWETRNNMNDDLQFEFIFCVDNSGSMRGQKIRQALNTLVILMETFHRLEWKFGVLTYRKLAPDT